MIGVGEGGRGCPKRFYAINLPFNHATVQHQSLCNALVHVIYSVVSGQYLYTIQLHFNNTYPSKLSIIFEIPVITLVNTKQLPRWQRFDYIGSFCCYMFSNCRKFSSSWPRLTLMCYLQTHSNNRPSVHLTVRTKISLNSKTEHLVPLSPKLHIYIFI